jgi:hypothetical protein
MGSDKIRDVSAADSGGICGRKVWKAAASSSDNGGGRIGVGYPREG